MEIDASRSRQSSQDYSYTVDGGIPDAQFDEAMNSFLDDALNTDLDLTQRRHESPDGRVQDGDPNHQEDSEYLGEDGDSGDEGEEGQEEETHSEHPSSASEPEMADEPSYGLQKSSTASRQKRRRTDPQFERPFKRKRAELTAGYLDLLNTEIREASVRGCIDDRDIDEDGAPAYRGSQLGLALWSPVEKRILYETVSRLGRNAIANISAAIGSKSVVEVEDYLNHVQYALEDRKSKLRSVRSVLLQPSERPAAIELSPQCCHALDEAADTLSLLQEEKEKKREEKKWGASWQFTSSMFEVVSEEDKGKPLDERVSELGGLFDIPRWLHLSSRVFMNSAIPSNNWNFVDEEPPSIWATAMEDFHSLTVSITRRLVQTAMFVAMSRIRAKKEAEPRILDVVRREDVEAALQSLNMEDKRVDFWRGCARRLRLNVQDNESNMPGKERKDGVDGRDYMTYEEVEMVLGPGSPEPEVLCDIHASTVKETLNDNDSAAEDGVTENEADVESSSHSDNAMQLTAEEQAVRDEAEEVVLYSGVDFPQSTRSKEALLNRISGERRQEEYADRCDEQASREGEVKMWELLERPVPPSLRAKEAIEQPLRSNLTVDGVYSAGRSWRRALQYYAEWETNECASDGGS